MAQETIAAVATPFSTGGIGIVRISGEQSFAVADAVFRAKGKKTLSGMKGYTAAYGHVFEDGKLIDECVALVFRAPKSYTGEDVVELSCHGGVQVIRRVLEAVVRAGARLAEPGEFTRRAFLNGRIDLTQAESVMELIGAKSAQAAEAAAQQTEGALSRAVARIREILTDISADISAYVDFPEEDIPDLSEPILSRKLEEIRAEIEHALLQFEKGRILREGVSAVIAGRPNVGKSTLMNRIAGYEKSIVTEIAGTTRDLVEESIQFAGCMLNLTDTAGLRRTENAVERIGVKRAEERLKTAQLVFAVFDASAPLREEDRRLLTQLAGRRAVAVLNKSDLPIKIDVKYIRANIQHIVNLSAASGEGMDELERVTAGLLETGELDPGAGILATERQRECAVRALEGIEAALGALRDGMTLDAVSTGVEQAVEALEMLTGQRATEDILSRVFEKFCVGK